MALDQFIYKYMGRRDSGVMGGVGGPKTGVGCNETYACIACLYIYLQLIIITFFGISFEPAWLHTYIWHK